MKVYLPQVHGNATVEGEGEHVLNSTEQALCALAESHPEQGRATMHLHPLLSRVARAHCLDMATRRYAGHTNPEGYGPNHRVTVAGYALPNWYGDDPDANNIESLQWGGDGNLDHGWPAWLSSEKHRLHILGSLDFYKKQTNYGVGFVQLEGSAWGCYYCFLSAPPEGN